MPVTIQGIDEAIARLEGAAERCLDLRPVLRSEAKRIEAVIAAAWSGQRSPDGTPWPPRREPAPARRSRRVRIPRNVSRHGGGTGTLERAHTVDASRNTLRIRVPVGYASYQFFGTDHAPGRNPLPVRRTSRGYAWAGGPAGAILDELVANVKAFIVGGRRGR